MISRNRAPDGIKPQQAGAVPASVTYLVFPRSAGPDRQDPADASVVQDFSIFPVQRNAIGIVTVIALDTNYYRCTAWLPPANTSCLHGPRYRVRRTFHDHQTGHDRLSDTNKVKLFPGSLTALGGFVCGISTRF